MTVFRDTTFSPTAPTIADDTYCREQAWSGRQSFLEMAQAEQDRVNWEASYAAGLANAGHISITVKSWVDTIICPSCGERQEATVFMRTGRVWPDFFHECVKCEYLITESEWNIAQVQQ